MATDGARHAPSPPTILWQHVLSPGSLSPLLDHVPKQFPRWMRVRQNLPAEALDDPRVQAREAVAEGLARGARPVTPGMRIAITAGSRGISRLTDVLLGCIEALKAHGAEPFIVAAMGSHGGATPEGQGEILASYGITEGSMGVPIDTRMDVRELGRVGQVPIYFSEAALEADGVLVVGRVKPHTSFRASVESGICKMMAVGLGKHRGAQTLHADGMDALGRILPEAAALIIQRAPIIGAVPLIENARQQLAHLEWVEPDAILSREPELLEMAWRLMPQILAKDLDVLIIDEIGKNISGTGMDPNVTGRFYLPSMPRQPWFRRIVVRTLTPETHGNFNGLTQADIITRRVVEAMDFYSTYTNCMTSTALEAGRVPVIVEDDRDAIALALHTSGRRPLARKRLARIRNTGSLEEIDISEGLWEDEREKGLFTPLTELEPMRFSSRGELLPVTAGRTLG